MTELLKKSLPIKKIQGKDLLVDAHYVDSDAPGPRPAILYFHGGFLVRQKFFWSCNEKNRLGHGYRFMPSSRTIVSMQVVGYLYDEAIILRVQHAWLALIGGAI